MGDDRGRHELGDLARLRSRGRDRAPRLPDRRRWSPDHPLDLAIVVFTPPFLPSTRQAARVFRLLRPLRLLNAGLLATPCQPHESSVAPSVLSDEMRALAAMRPATPPTAIKPAFAALDDGRLARPDVIPLGRSSGVSSRSRCSRLLRSKSRIGSSPFSAWYETRSQSPRRARAWS